MSSHCLTCRFQHPPGVGQNIAWALTEELNISRIIDDLWYRDIRYSCWRVSWYVYKRPVNTVVGGIVGTSLKVHMHEIL
jgi:hypothetical protein